MRFWFVLGARWLWGGWGEVRGGWWGRGEGMLLRFARAVKSST
jgi:hypothetical protein